MRWDRKLLVDDSQKEIVVNLFKEFARTGTKRKPPFTLKQWKEIYLEICDPTEYKFAMECVGSWTHWQKIKNHPFIKPHVDQWREELDIKFKSEAVEYMRKQAVKDGGTAAAKWLAEKGYENKSSVGRPKRPINEVPEEERHDADAVRLGLVVVGGKK